MTSPIFHKTYDDPDGSINYVWALPGGGVLEAREVRREEGELIIYISSQDGCKQACRMCHLTQTGQTSGGNATPAQMLQQFCYVLNRTTKPVDRVNVNFMARGEPLANPYVDDELLMQMYLATCYPVRFKISTIMPREDPDLVRRFHRSQPDLYYSLYSVDPTFRKRWFPRALDPQHALAKLKAWQDFTHKIPRLHLALIKGWNDYEQSIEQTIQAVLGTGLRVDWNIVRYNPFDETSEEGDWALAAELLRSARYAQNVQVVNRVGPQVAASCGMFTDGDGNL